MSQVATNNLHAEIVTGIVQIIRFVGARMKERRGFNLGEIIEVGCAGKSEDAGMFIIEFAKDGVVNLDQAYVDSVIAGDYSRVWKLVNNFLKNFGHSPVEPTTLEIA